ncbi:MAG: 50S ribosomal protein L22 [Armatimonadetes bacterium]|nr:50S ribosomal protein L22 [Armatimonadota bacterium]
MKAIARYLRSAPRKLRLVADLIRGKAVNEARVVLQFTPKRAARTMAKVLNSAVANAENNKDLDPESLVVHKVFVDEGPALKRWTPRARGRASAIRRRTSHITLVVKQREEGL